MAVRQGALDSQVVKEIGNCCSTLEDGSKVRDDFVQELGEISDGLFANFCAVTLCVSEEDGCVAKLVGDGFDIIGHGVLHHSLQIWELNN